MSEKTPLKISKKAKENKYVKYMHGTSATLSSINMKIKKGVSIDTECGEEGRQTLTRVRSKSNFACLPITVITIYYVYYVR